MSESKKTSWFARHSASLLGLVSIAIVTAGVAMRFDLAWGLIVGGAVLYADLSGLIARIAGRTQS